MITSVMVAVSASAMIGAIEDHKAFEKSLINLPEAEQEKARARRQKAIDKAASERRHRELVEASKPKSGFLPFLFGFILGRS